MKLINLLIFGITFSSNLWGQDPVFNQTDNSKNYLNPAYIGTEKSFSADLNYRNQWPESSVNYRTTTFQMNQYLGKGNGIGLNFMDDNAGSALKKINIGIGYAKRIDLRENHHITIGTQVSYFQKSLDWDKLIFGNMIDPRQGFIYPASYLSKSEVRGFDLNAGVLFYNRFVFVGYSAQHLTQPNESFTSSIVGLPMKHLVEVGGKLKWKEVAFVPSLRFYDQETFNTTFAALKIDWKILEVNTGIQFQNGIFLGIGIKTESFNLSYNYTSSINDINARLSTHELRMGCDLKLFNKENEQFFDF